MLLGEENKVGQRHFLSETRDWTGASIIALARLAVYHAALQFLRSNAPYPTIHSRRLLLSLRNSSN